MLHLQLKSDRYTARAYTVALWCTSVLYIVFLIGLTFVWRVPSSSILKISLRSRTQTARIVLAPVKKNSNRQKVSGKNAGKKIGELKKTSSIASKKKQVVKKQIVKQEVEKKTAAKSLVKKPKLQPKSKLPVKVKPVVPTQKKESNKQVPKPVEKKKPVENKPQKKKKELVAKKPVVKKIQAVQKKLEAGSSVKSKQKSESKVPPKASKPFVEKGVKKVPVNASSDVKNVQKKMEKPVVSSSKERVPSSEKLVSSFEAEVNKEFLSLDGDNLQDRDVAAFIAAIRRVWRLPRGLRTDLKAQVLLDINARGEVAKVSVVNSSGVVSYDLAARAALHRAQYPAVFWGKKIVVEFGKELNQV